MNAIQCETRTYEREYNTHDHSYGQMLFALHGAMEIHTPVYDTFQLEANFGLYLPPHVNHRFRAVARNEFLVVDIPARFLGDAVTTEQHVALDETWGALCHLFRGEAYQPASSQSLRPLVDYLTSKLAKKTLPASIHYMKQHFSEPLSLETLAAIEHYHPAYYSSWFKGYTGMSPSEYLQKLRVKAAKRLLGETTWSVARISIEVGYTHPSGLVRAFTKVEGMTPSAYRNTLH
ncbi:helix-turn-helix transcriptional regulator [Halalkalibacterium halodurans]|uniref:helix-turn-helix transcriptional regulator n=1 Tax=Halalkalibacterium halodurans TaxID=86665 RepID=UPI002AAA3027|nr:AraC family transcriptional regulator [Halalkalibacterium halodurans]MDY7222346.1 AraC family transcriptional regulator [Halalkalibacterium halodurans]MDY7241567.1 AraC family transcriptional regulator [Halalkalibacterium halodurans]